MIEIDIPGYKVLKIENLVLDFNGTIAVDGILMPSAISRLNTLSKELKIYILSAHTFGSVREQCNSLPVEVRELKQGNEKEQKGEFIDFIGPDRTCAIGNGSVDELMLKKSALAISVFGHEASSLKSLLNSDIAVVGIIQALNLLLKPKRLIATLRQ